MYSHLGYGVETIVSIGMVAKTGIGTALAVKVSSFFLTFSPFLPISRERRGKMVGFFLVS